MTTRASGPEKPSQAVIDAYLRQVALDRWHTERWQHFANVMITLVWLVIAFRSRDKQRQQRRQPIRFALTVFAQVVAVGFNTWRFVTPPNESFRVILADRRLSELRT